tara:strand:- start:894 stop:1250 length:357 start_codon:yes stop_codon:yes gene_type:complete
MAKKGIPKRKDIESGNNKKNDTRPSKVNLPVNDRKLKYPTINPSIINDKARKNEIPKANAISFIIGFDINAIKYLGINVVEPEGWFIIPVAGRIGNKRNTRKTANTTSAAKRPRKLSL